MKSTKKLLILLLTTSFLAGCGQVANKSNNASSFSNISSSPSSSSSKNNETSSDKKDSSIRDNLESNPKTCDNHVLTESIIKEASIINRGIKRQTCLNCGGFTEAYYYKLDEYDFSDVTYMYDGYERELLIDGLIPYGTHATYENNKLTEIGHKEATAKVYDEDNNLLDTKTAKISIVDNIGLPNVRVTTSDGEDPDWHTNSDGSRTYSDMTLTIDNCEDEFKKNEIPGEIKVRGNSTNQESVAKRAFRLKMSSKVNLLGLNDGLKEKSWVLLADFFDQSKFRNASAFEMGNSLFNYSNYYSSDYKHVVFYMNGENRGVYLLAEQQQAKDGRIPIYETNTADDGTKIGYLVEIDGLVNQQGHIDKNTGLGVLEGDPCFQTDSAGRVGSVNISNKPYVIKTDTYSDEQRLFIKKYLSSCTKAFASICNNDLQIVDSNGDLQKSPYNTQYETLNSFIDVDSFMRMYLLQEFLKDYDVGWGSFYLYIDFTKASKVKRLTMAAPWDFDLGVGNKQSGGWGGGFPGWGGGGSSSSSDKDIPSSGISSTKDSFLSNTEYTNGMTTFNPWLYMLHETDFFNDMFPRYYSVFNGSDIFEKVINNIAYERVAFLDVFNDNHVRYGKGASGATLMQTRQYDSFDDAVDYLAKWLNERKDYLDNKYLK